MVTGIREGDGTGGGGWSIRKLQKQDAKNAPRVQKNVDIHIIKIQQNVAAAEQTKNKKY
jgi:hypothetical protein